MINNHWKPYLDHEFSQQYMAKLRQFLKSEKSKNKVILPHSSNWFKAFELTDLPDILVVILGQDPYHGLNQAHGLCFSVPNNIPPPPSLKNIFQEITNDIGKRNSRNSNLENYAQQGVMLLNSVLTVELGRASSHANKGWEIFTDNIVKIINQKTDNTVFMLWGNYAQSKGSLINSKKHLVLKAAHPSPFSAHRGFFGCRHFSKANQYLQKHQKQIINW